MALYIWLKFVCSISGPLGLNDIKMKKKILAELGHIDRLKIYVDPCNIYIDPDF